MQRIPFETLYGEFLRVLLKTGLTQDRAELCARIFAENSRDGVYSHGLNRFPGFVRNIRSGRVDIHAVAEKAGGLGALEQWDGRLGPGPVNATICMDRAIALAETHGIGCVGLRNTNHWMRAGAYGLQAADAGCMGICWTNTGPLMPPWGSATRKIGNNPLVIAIPRPEGHILLDMAMSQFSGGKTEIYRRSNRQFPVPGGYDSAGALTCDPDAIHESKRPLPIGHWKGSGLAVLLDLVAALVSGGRSTCQIGREKEEYGVSQVFIAINVCTAPHLHQTMEETVQDLHSAPALEQNEPVRYPGEGMLQTRQDNLKNGIPVDEDYWQEVLEM